MNWCQEHWDDLKAMLKAKGLDELGAKSGQELFQNIKQEVETNDAIFDPLMGCWSRINAAMVQSPGLNGRILDCPLCILVTDGQPDLVNQWLNGCTDACRAYAIEEGILKPDKGALDALEGK